MTFIAMNRFRVARGREAEFEEVWRSRQSDLPSMPGFVVFHLLRGASDDQATLFVSHTVWETRAAFEDWTRSEAFRRAHSGAPKTAGLYLGPPQFEGFDAVAETLKA
jgi:heme-degrading monooxygenase HmoA